MINVLKGFPRNVCAFTADGNTSLSELVQVLLPRIYACHNRYGSVHLLMKLEEDGETKPCWNWIKSMAVLLNENIIYGKIAVVTDLEIDQLQCSVLLSKWGMTNICGFSSTEFSQASYWIKLTAFP